MESTSMNESQDLQRLADTFVRLFPKLEEDSRRATVTIYRMLARGAPVEPAEVATAAGLSRARTNELLAGWPGVYFEEGREEGRITGFGGLTCRPISNHLFKVGGRTLYTWCAWDTLFIPQFLGETAQVESTCPVTGEVIRLTVSPRQVENLAPEGAVMSMLEPPEDIMEDIVSKFCHHVFFFRDGHSGAEWTEQHPGAGLMSIRDGFELGRLKNAGRFGDALKGG